MSSFCVCLEFPCDLAAPAAAPETQVVGEILWRWSAQNVFAARTENVEIQRLFIIVTSQDPLNRDTAGFPR